MTRLTQKLGMNHILDLKQDALKLWNDYEQCPFMWYDCVEAVLLIHRLNMKQQYDREDLKEMEKDRRSQHQILEDEVAEYEQRMQQAAAVFTDYSEE